MKTFPPAPTMLPPNMTELIVRLAELWAQNPERPRPSSQVCEHWDRLIAAWADDVTLPLYIRKVANNRGSVVVHISGRHLVPTDNSPAQWAFALAILGEMPSLEDIRRMIEEDRIPVAMIFKSIERITAKYRCTLGTVVNPNSAGWKVAHIKDVGFGNRKDLVELESNILLDHFRKLMMPGNMFVVPTKYSGLGELPEFCKAVGVMNKLA